jgi:ribosomal protein S6
LNTYEGLFIFDDTLKDEELSAVQDKALAEIERQGGSVLGAKRLGRRNFARPMAKRQSGNYVRAIFNLDPNNVTPLLARYKLSEDVFRVQITRGDSKSMELVREITDAAVAQKEAEAAKEAPEEA